MSLFDNMYFNVFGLITMVVILTPNLLYMFMQKSSETYKPTPLLNTMEQIGRYGSMLFMILVIPYQEVSEQHEIIFIIVVAILTVLYVWTWRAYFFKESKNLKLALAIIPSVIFIVSAIVTFNIPLFICGSIFAISHMMITKRS